ncbi:FHA domain protein [Ruegeria sp. TrichCH4B]|nr:FHA domain protein [Ruegeria sp. TrichCH4B]
MSADDITDGWTQPTHTFEKSAELHLKIQTIEGVDPLDAQFGIDTPKTVPDALYEALFGQPEPTEDELAASRDDPAKIPPMRTYAILDAAKITNLPELLEASPLEHRCLFKGSAYDALKDAAPWVVRLEGGNSFTRNLFTRSSAPWHQWWDSEPGIYVRSRGTLDEIWAHFRKFTRVQDADGKWYYFRFWEPKSVERMFSAFSHSEAQHFLAPCFDLYTITLAPRVSCKRLFIEHSHFSV